MKLSKISLKGAIGIPYDINLELEDKKGVIGIIGENGIGKSTFVWHLLPYTMDILKGWTLAKRFRKGGSKRLIYSLDGHTHEVNIELPKSDPLCSYKIDGIEKNTSLKQSLYDAVVDEWFMPLSMATHSVYTVEATAIGRGKSQKLTTSLALLSPSERKEYFIELFGLDEYSVYKDLSKQRREEELEVLQGIEKELAVEEGKLSMLSPPLSEQKKAEIKEEISTLHSLSKELERQWADYRTYTIYLDRVKKASESRQALLNEYHAESLEELSRYAEELQLKYREMEARYNALQDISPLQAELKQLRKEHDSLEEERKALYEAYALMSEGSRYKQELSELKLKLERVRETLKNMRDAQASKGAAVEALRNVACEPEVMSHCGLYQWAHKVAEGGYREEILTLTDEIRSMEAIYAERMKSIKELGDKVLGICKKYSLEPTQLDKRINECSSTVARLEESIKHKQESLVALEEKQEGVSQKDLQELKQRITLLKEKLSNVVAPPPPMKAVKKPTQEVRDVEKRASEFTNLLIQADSDAQKREQLEKSIATLSLRRKEAQLNVSEWGKLVEAFGTNGIVAFELEHLIPVVESKVNALLEGTPYELYIRTYEYKHKGTAKEKVKELFDIRVKVDGEDRAYTELSAGQRVLPELALSQAISIVLGSDRYKMASLFIDERDGSLSQQSKQFYIEMVKRAHAISGRYTTFIISHDPVIWTACDWVIYLKKEGYVVDRPENLTF